MIFLPVTYKAIATVTVGSGGASSIEFTSIPQTYTDLVIKFSGRSNTTGNEGVNVEVNFNGNSANYSERQIYGNGSEAVSYTNGSSAYINRFFAAAAAATPNTFSSTDIYIPNYTSSNNKSVSGDSLSENNNTTAPITLEAGLWSNSAAITSIKLDPSGDWVQYTTATLYGIKNS